MLQKILAPQLLVGVIVAIGVTFPVTTNGQSPYQNNGYGLSPLSPSSTDRDAEEQAEGLEAEAVEVKYINKVDVPAKTDGVLVDIVVEEGNLVDEGEILAVVDNRAAVLTVELKKAEEFQARHKAKDDVNLRDAKNNKEFAETEAIAYRALNEQGAVQWFEMRRKELEVGKQSLRIELAEMEETTRKIDVLMKQTELKLAEEQLARCKISAPTPGYVEQRLAQKGQWVQAGTPICTLIRMDKLRVEGKISGLSYPGQIVKGHPVKIRIETSNSDRTELDGVLGYVSMEMDVNGQHRVWAEVENRRNGEDWLIKPGMRAEIIVPL